MIPDDGDDAATAMAMVNTEMMIDINMPAIVTPTFVEGAASIGLLPGENLPFTYVEWATLQSLVVTEGATFEVTAVELGANQVPVPVGPTVFVTCGPFACAEDTMDPPEISIADSDVCNDWEYSIALNVGFVDNTAMNLDPDGPDTDGDPDGDTTLDDGIDVAWVYTSNTDLEVTHHFGNALMVEAKAGEASRMTALSVSGGGPALIHPVNPPETAPATPTMNLSHLFNVPTGGAATERWACDSLGQVAPTDPPDSDYNPANLSVTMPDGCFRVSANGANYLADYTIELAAVGSAVSWGSVDWEEVFEDDEEANPFLDLSCDTVMVAAADEVDVCALFEDEVDRALEAGWAGASVYNDAGNTFVAVDIASPTADVPGTAELTWEAESKSEARQFSTIWWDIDDSGKPTDDLYNDTDDETATGGEATPAVRDGLVVELLDDDGDPMYGDIGKVDRKKKAASPPTAMKNSADGADGTADNYSDENAACSDDDGGDGCDAKVVIEKDYTFHSGTAFECEAERTLAIECTWDAQGQMDIAASAALAADGTNLGNFLACKVKE